MNIFPNKKSPKKITATGKRKRIFDNLFFSLLCSLLYMTLPQLAFYLTAQNYAYYYGTAHGLLYLITGLLLWFDTFVMSHFDCKINGGLAFCGFISGLILIINTAYNFITLYQYVQTYCM